MRRQDAVWLGAICLCLAFAVRAGLAGLAFPFWKNKILRVCSAE
jgi:hypothetical protein